MPKVKKGTKPGRAADEKLEEEWKKIQETFQHVLHLARGGYKAQNNQDKIEQKVKAYTVVYDLCTTHDSARGNSNANNAPPAEVLYRRAKAMVENYLGERVTSQVTQTTGEELLKNVYEAWKEHQIVVNWARIMFKYLDEYHTKQSSLDPVRAMLLKCFQTAVYDKVKAGLTSVLLSQVASERDGNTINRQVMRESINLFVEMGLDNATVYKNDFEKDYVEATGQFYQRASAQWLGNPGGIHTYLHNVEKSLGNEKQRIVSYLHSSSSGKVIEKVQAVLLTEPQMRVFEDPDGGAAALLDNWKTEDLGRMYRLFKEIEKGLEPMSEITREFVKKEGSNLNRKFCIGDMDQKGYIEALIELHDKFGTLFKEQFEDSPIFHKARKEAFEVFTNDTLQPEKAQGATATPAKVTSSELLSTYADNLMKNEKIAPDDLDAMLDKIVAQFMYITDKDLFQEFYRKQMSKRLLVSKTDNENERQLIAKLKLKMGAPYTSKLEGMITDKTVSGEQHKDFLAWIKNSDKKLEFDFSAQVLTTGFWPAFKADTLQPPPIFAAHMEIYKVYYNTKTNSRVLRWVHSLGTASLMGRFKKGNKEMLLSTYQACVLMLFNDKDSIQGSEFVEVLKIGLDEIKRTIHSLTYGKFPILGKEGGGKKTVGEKDTFVVNDGFTHPQRKFKVPNAIKMVGDPVEKTDESRRHVVDACVVRIMKSRKQFSHTELQTECIKQLSFLFHPDPKLIKKRIEDLIQRGYLERDQDDRNIYKYMA